MKNPYSVRDMEFVRRISDGDKDAENKFCRTYYRYIKGSVRRRGVPWRDVDDVTQLIVWAACLGLRNRTFKREGSLKNWLTAIITNKSIQYFRDNVRHRGVELDPSRESYPSRQDQKVMLAEAISLLTPKQRSIFLKHEEGLTIEKIAILTEIPAGTVGRMLSETRRKLQKILKGDQRF